MKLNNDVYFPVSHKNLFQYIKVTIKTRSKKQFQTQAVPFSVPKKKIRTEGTQNDQAEMMVTGGPV